MFENRIYKTEIGGKVVSVEVGKYAQQSCGSCIVKCGETVVMINANMSEKPREGVDFLPLSVDYEEKMYAVGKIPGGFKRREGKPSDNAILVSRLIDRPLRPLFPKNFYNDVIIIATVLSVDPDCPPEPLAMLGSSIALSISEIPFMGPTGSVIVGLVNGKFVINPDSSEQALSRMHLVVSGTKDAIMMVEAGAEEVSEEEMLDAIMFAHNEIKNQVKFQEDIIKEIGKTKFVIPELDDKLINLKNMVNEFSYDIIKSALDTTDNKTRKENLEKVYKTVHEKFSDFEDYFSFIDNEIYNITKFLVRKRTLEQGIRIDGRKFNEIRPIWCEVGLLPRVHGSGVFTRGLTQVLTTATLGTFSDIQKLDGIEPEEEKRYMHHYNMPAYSTGEARSLKSPGRREIGHGALAERALLPVIPSETDFPYSIRTVTEVLSSNGSTSQAAVCGSCLALMDAGVPIKAPVSGIAMGLMKDDTNNKVVVLSDIQGEEDFFGDMDFKVAGTKNGITAIQMDIKIKGIDRNILSMALEQSKQGRAFILEKMLETLPEPRKELSKYASKILVFDIDPTKIGDVVGKNGKIINKIIEQTGVKIELEDDGKVFIASPDIEACNMAKQIIINIVSTPQKGQQFEGVVTKITSFGAFIEFAFNKEGMIHISKLSTERVEKVEDVLQVNDKVKIEILNIDEKGRIDLKLIQKIK